MKTTLLTSLLAAGFASVPAHAAVTLATTGTGSSTAFANGVNTVTVSDFNVGNGNSLAVVVSTEINGGDQTGGPTPSYTVTFGGAGITNSVTATQGTQGAAVFWLLGVTADTVGSVVVDVDGGVDNNDRIGISVVSLQNVTAVGDTAFGNNTGGTIILPYDGAAGGLVIGGFVDNAFSNATDIPTITGGNIDTTLLAVGATQGGGSAAMIQGYGDISSTGTFSETFTQAGNSSRNAAALVAFVPEPSVALLGGLGALALLRRRRA